MDSQHGGDKRKRSDEGDKYWHEKMVGAPYPPNPWPQPYPRGSGKLLGGKVLGDKKRILVQYHTDWRPNSDNLMQYDKGAVLAAAEDEDERAAIERKVVQEKAEKGGANEDGEADV